MVNFPAMDHPELTERPTVATVPMRHIGPLLLRHADDTTEEVHVPMATYESPLWPSVGRGARVSMHAGGIATTLVDERMTRSILVEADTAAACHAVAIDLRARFDELREQASTTSRFVRLIDLHPQQVGNQLFLRLEYTTGDASGHNMTTKASDHLLRWILAAYPNLRHVSVSGNACTDKKVSAINGIRGRGKHVIAELTIPGQICRRFLKTTPAKLADINLKKNLLGSAIAGSLRSGNAHFANMLLAFYLATGQDAANLVEGSQGFTFIEPRGENGEDVYVSVSLPHLIVGTVGNGKGLPFVTQNLAALGCTADRDPGDNARRLARICAASVLCGELSLLAALTNPGELMAAHIRLERQAHTS